MDVQMSHVIHLTSLFSYIILFPAVVFCVPEETWSTWKFDLLHVWGIWFIWLTLNFSIILDLPLLKVLVYVHNVMVYVLSTPVLSAKFLQLALVK